MELGRISGSVANAWWYNPRDGLTYDQNGDVSMESFGEYSCSSGDETQSFDPPGSGELDDWVLVLDDQAAGFDVPGLGGG